MLSGELASAIPDSNGLGSSAEIRAFVDAQIVPFAGEWDSTGTFPRDTVRAMGRQGYFGALFPGMRDQRVTGAVSYGVLSEEVGRGCSSARSLITVQSMVGFAIDRWGGKHLKGLWLPLLVSGERLAAFALSEPDVGSDPAAITTCATRDSDHYVVSGRKSWITFGQYADVFLIFARAEQGIVALLVNRDTPGLRIHPLDHISGVRASMLADLELDACRVPVANRLGNPGFGLSVALSALDIGRLGVACGCVGIMRAAYEATLEYAQCRTQYGATIGSHQLIRAMIANMATDLRAARELCACAAALHQAKHPDASHEIFIAKYFASCAASRVANDAVQVHGAKGLSERLPLERYMRDARTMEIIEGTTQLMQIVIAAGEFERFASAPPTSVSR